MKDEKQIILFDGVCNFCNFWVDFVINRDKKDLFRFAALQSDKAKLLTNNLHFDTAKLKTVILISGENIFTESTAALMICKQLSGPVKVLFPLIIFPKFIRDFVYEVISKNRYKIFGKRESCRVPSDEEKKKFL